MKNRNHYVIFFENNQLIHTTPKDWARLHKEEFHNFDFIKKIPTTDEISTHLIKNYGYTRIESENQVVTIQL